MSIAQRALADLEHEIAGTRRVLERYPTGKDDFTPHPKSMTLSKLATHVAEIPLYGTIVLSSDELDFMTNPPPRPKPTTNDAAGMMATFEEQWAELQRQLANADDERMKGTWTMRAGEHVIMSLPRVAAMRGLVISHLIHHRAQLVLYYRMLDIPVPGLYGPSADEQ